MICTRIVTAGIALLIALPILRVILMLIVFVRERELRFSVIALLVLAIILCGFCAWYCFCLSPQPSRGD